MKNNQNNLLTTGHAVSAMMEIITATSAPPALAAARTALDNLLAEIKWLADAQANPLPPKTQERNKEIDAASRAAHIVARLVRGHALATGQMALAGQVDFSATDLLTGRFTRRLQYMRQIHTAASPLVAELTGAGLTPALVEDLATKIGRAEEVLSLPRNNIATRRVATRNLAEAFAKLDRMLLFTFDPLMETLSATDPDAYTRYTTARRVIDRTSSRAADPDAPAKSALATSHAPLASQPLAA